MQASELEPLVGGTGTDTIDGVVPEGDEREEDMSDLKIAFRSEFKTIACSCDRGTISQGMTLRVKNKSKKESNFHFEKRLRTLFSRGENFVEYFVERGRFILNRNEK